MPLSERTIEQLTREPLRTPGWSSRLLMFSGTIFFVSLFVYVGLVYGYKPYLVNQVQKLKDQIESFSQKISTEDQAKIVRFYSQSSNLKTLLDNHVTASPLFTWLETNTEANIFFTRFVLNTATNELALAGAARNPGDVNQQATIFQKRPEVERMNFSNLAVGSSGLWEFNLTLFLRPEFVRRQGIESPSN